MKLHKKLISASMALLASTSLAVLPTTQAQTTTHTVQSGEYLQGIAAAYGVTAEELRAWNGLSSDMIYVGDVLVVDGSSSGTVVSNSSSAGTHVVQNGDVLYNLAIRYGVTVDDLMAWNGLTSDWLNVGDTLVVYGNATATGGNYYYDYTAPVSTSSTGYHTVAPGDTLSGIAAVYGVTEEELWAWNGLSSDWLNVGDQIAVTGYSSGATSTYTNYVPTTNTTTTNYTVSAGDSLYEIAQAYGTTVDNLMAINGLSSTFLQIGDQLVVPGADKSATSEAPTEETTEETTTEDKNKEENKEEATETSTDLTDEEKAAGIKAKHIIQKGETLFKIANKYGVTLYNLKSWNNITAENPARVGDELIIKDSAYEPQKHKVVEGDTIDAVAETYQTTADAIKVWNELADNELEVGKEIYVSNPEPTLHEVQTGENLQTIADQYGVTPEDLRAWNGLPEKSMIVNGTILVSDPTAVTE